MIKLFLPVLIALTLITVGLSEARADSLVCQYFINGEYKILIYTEVPNAKDNEINIVTSSRVVTFGNGSKIYLYLSGDTDCIFLDDSVGKEQTALNYFLGQVGINQELE